MPNQLTVFLFSLFSICICFSCHQENGLSDCERDYLNEYGFKAYTGEPIPCGVSYLVMYQREQTQFALLHNDCADLAHQLILDCDGNEICVYTTEEGCFEWVLEAERMGVIGFEK